LGQRKAGVGSRRLRTPRRPGCHDGFGYSWFCDFYCAWAGRLKPTLRQAHPAGEFAPHTPEVIDGRPAKYAAARSSSPSSARPCKPRNKAKVEVGVQVPQRWILARLRNRRFFSLTELNQAIRNLTDQLNDRTLRGWGTTRRALQEQFDRPALRPLPPTPYEGADWKRCLVNLGYHVEIEKHFHSVSMAARIRA